MPGRLGNAYHTMKGTDGNGYRPQVQGLCAGHPAGEPPRVPRVFALTETTRPAPRSVVLADGDRLFGGGAERVNECETPAGCIW